MSADGELMLTILASYAQEESLSASENQKWRIRKGFERGEMMGLRFLYGYTIKKGVVTINPAQAEIVREIFRRVERLKKATAERESQMQRDRELRIFIGSIKEQPLVLETWDEGLWLTLLETATVHADNSITFRFKDGTDIEVGAE